MMRVDVFVLMICLSSCSALNEPSALDQQAAFSHDVADAQEAQADEALRVRQGALAEDHSSHDTLEQQNAARFAEGVTNQQTAKARLDPLLRECLSANAHRLSTATTKSVNSKVDAVLRACYPVMEAVARTVELAHMPSEGLTDEMAARLRPGVKRMVEADRVQVRTLPNESNNLGSSVR